MRAQFVDQGAATNTNHGSNKDGGVAWADLNNDGCLDIIFNTTQNNAANRSRILFSDCNLPNPTFTDVTAAKANGLTIRELDRSISVGDYNNDGNIDFARNIHNRFEIYLNNGPPNYTFGDAAQNANLTITAIPGGMNSEGFGWMDYNNDGWLDLIIENHNFGIDIYENPADGTANFFHVTPNGNSKGLPTGGTTGDYMVLGDYNDDGFIDIFARKQGEFDIWTNTGLGTFVVNNSINPDANNSNKGGVLMCDFDNDGDFDLFWSDQGVNQIYTQNGLNSGVFTATNEPANSSGVTPTGNIDGCSCGDVDNDGDMDLFLGANSGTSYLYLNSPGLNFTRNNMGINVNGNVEGNSFADYDEDGDLDLYINRNGGNQLWRNSTNNNNYLKVHVKRDLGGGIYRDDLGATVVLKDCNGNVLSGIRQVSSVKGHGSNDPAVVHFGLPNGNNVGYLVEVRFTSNNGVRAILDSAVTPSFLPNQEMTFISPVGAGLFDGCLYVLPVELLSFDAVVNGNEVDLKWITTTEINNDFFTVERSKNGKEWEEVLITSGAGNSSAIIEYFEKDYSPLNGTSYYRLKQTDFDGNYSFSNIVPVYFGADNGGISIFPNPVGYGGIVNINIEKLQGKDVLVVLRDVIGREFYSKVSLAVNNGSIIGIPIDKTIPSGVYLITATSENHIYSKKLIIE